jgi:hypothetical protein
MKFGQGGNINLLSAEQSLGGLAATNLYRLGRISWFVGGSQPIVPDDEFPGL